MLCRISTDVFIVSRPGPFLVSVCWGVYVCVLPAVGLCWRSSHPNCRSRPSEMSPTGDVFLDTHSRFDYSGLGSVRTEILGHWLVCVLDRRWIYGFTPGGFTIVNNQANHPTLYPRHCSIRQSDDHFKHTAPL